MTPWFFNIASAVFGTVHSAAGEKSKEQKLGWDWNSNIKWNNWEEGVEDADKKKSGMMVVIYRPGERASEALRPRFHNSKEIYKYSTPLTMVILEDGQDKGLGLNPDGNYVPRIVFCDEKAKAMPEYFNRKGCDTYKYYYNNIEAIIEVMQEVSTKMEQRHPKKKK